MSVSDRRASYASHDWPSYYVCVTVGRSDISKLTEGSWQGAFPVNSERSVRTLKIALSGIFQGQTFADSCSIVF